jgi:RNA polymerase sigma factor (TIGR02999 family)
MSSTESDESAITRCLQRVASGDRLAAADLLPLVYGQLRALAQREMGKERPGHTLTATALVHEAYLRLDRSDCQVAFQGRGHFYAAAAEAMRRHLIDHARARLAQKRGGPGEHVEGGERLRRVRLDELREVADLARDETPEEILSLDRAVSRLEREDPQAATIVRMRFYAGLSVEQTADVMGVSPATVKRDWQYARLWLFKQLRAEAGDSSGPGQAT